MIALDELLRQVEGLDRGDLIRWVENRWVLPERRDQTWLFHEVDIARVADHARKRHPRRQA